MGGKEEDNPPSCVPFLNFPLAALLLLFVGISFGFLEYVNRLLKKEEWAGQNKKQELSDFGWCLHIDLPPILLVRGRRALFPLLFLAHPVSTRSSSLCSGLPRGRQHKHVCFARLRTTVSLFLLFISFLTPVPRTTMYYKRRASLARPATSLQ